MSPISRGFRGRRPQVDSARLPPGQHVVDDFPVLSAGSTPHRPLDEWTFEISGAVDQPVAWRWDELLALPAETPTVDIHCVTAWSKLDTNWTGVSVDTVLAGLETEAEYVSAWCDDGYRTNLPLEDVTGAVTDYVDAAREAINDTVEDEIRGLRKAIRKQRKRIGI
jgi:DMSO/TMAO reductase YedYZ molybdopterin-dependent catalytic subunit